MRPPPADEMPALPPLARDDGSAAEGPPQPSANDATNNETSRMGIAGRITRLGRLGRPESALTRPEAAQLHAFRGMPQPVMLRTRSVLLLVGALAMGCQRADHSALVEPAVSPLVSANPTLIRAQAVVAPGCIVPLADAPAPAAKPAARCPKDPAAPPPLRRGIVRFLGGAQPSIEVELALSPEDQQHGLMYRTDLAPESGMLFSWSNETIHTFWMHNTCLPLDMLFIAADGTIFGVLEQVPVLNDDPRSVPCPAAHVLEVNAGYCRQHGIQPGQRVRIKAS